MPSGASAVAVRLTWLISGRPSSLCSTFARSDLIRVPRPAASIKTLKDRCSVEPSDITQYGSGGGLNQHSPARNRQVFLDRGEPCPQPQVDYHKRSLRLQSIHLIAHHEDRSVLPLPIHKEKVEPLRSAGY